MSSKKKLYDAINQLSDMNDKLKAQNSKLVKQREALVQENLKLTAKEAHKDEVLEALGQNIIKSLKNRSIINMKPDEKDAMYYMLQQYHELLKA